MAYTPTDEQAAIVSGIALKDGPSVMTNAYAGCSKTTTIEMSAPGVRTPALAIAFNKINADEMAKRLPGNFTCKTMNGLGHGAWARAIGATRIQVDDRKVGGLVTQIAKDRKVDLLEDQWGDLRKLVTGAMAAGLVPDTIGVESLVPDSPEGWMDIADRLWITADDAEFLREMAREILIESIKLARQGIISFDDQIYCPVMLGGKWLKYPFIAVDEAQDLSAMNHLQVQLCLHPGGRLFVVGDEKQAIYAWRGADGNSMENLRELRADWSDLPLQTTFRCPQIVVERNKAHAPGFTAWHTNRPGIFEQWVRDLEGKGWDAKDLEPGSAVLCRNNAPLMALAMKLLRSGIGVKVQGRDIGKSLESLSKKIVRKDDATELQCVEAITKWQDRECAMARANNHEERCESINDRAEALLAVLQGGKCKTSGDLRRVLHQLFESKSGQLTLSTVHRAKGLEWESVMLLDPWRIPSKYAREQALNGFKIPLQQENNLRYVAETRTRNKLVYASLEDCGI